MRGLGSIRRWGAGHWSAVAGIVGAVATVVALFLPGGGDDGAATGPDPSIEGPKRAAREALQHFHGARFDAEWEGLHPVDQKAVPRRRFVSCEERAPKPVQLLSLTLQDPVRYPERLRPTIPVDDVRVVDGRVHTLARISGRESEDRDVVTVFVARDGDGWKVLLPAGDLATFRRGGCPYEDPDRLKGPDPQEEFSTPESFD